MAGLFADFFKKLAEHVQNVPTAQPSQPTEKSPHSAGRSEPRSGDLSAKQPTQPSTPVSASTTIWKARPIFFSSTFKDMHAERDYLRDHTFPRLAERLRARCHYLDTIDLRQGIESAHEADEAEREMQVLKVCLDEIDRSRPFLVALLGDRYGWIPPANRITAAARDAGVPESVDLAGKSVTELEILYGVLENPDQSKRSWFYFRTLDRTSMPPKIAARFPAEEPDDDPFSPARRLQALKERIRAQMPDRVRDYRLRWDREQKALVGLESLDVQVEADLWGDLDTETAAYLREAPTTWQEADALAVADFVAERIRGYVERLAITTPMLAHALSPPDPRANWGLVITGESGGGKSSIFGTVFQTLQPQAEAREILLLAHAAGIFPMSGQVDRMLRRWIGELAAFLEIVDPLEDLGKESAKEQADQTRPGQSVIVTSEEIEKTFASLLGQAASQIRVVVLVDALNQFEPTVRASHLTWLPRIWPENARFLATAIPGSASNALKDRPGASELTVPPVSRDEARAIAERFYRERHHREVNSRVLGALLDKKDSDRTAHANPLWLALALQEMNLLEGDDFERADRDYGHLQSVLRLEALQLDEAKRLPCDVPGAYGELLDRAERLYGRAWARSFTDLIALGRAGWRESDLQVIMPLVSGKPWDNLAFASLRRTFGSHVVQRGAQSQWDFFHTALRQTVIRRNLADEIEQKRLHGLLASHLQALPTRDPLFQTETMVHLIGLGDRDHAAGHLAALHKEQWSNPEKIALNGAVTVIVEAIQAAPDREQREKLSTWISNLMDGEAVERSGRVASVVLFDVSDALAITGTRETEVVRASLLDAVRQTLERLAAADPSNAGWQRDLSVSQIKIGNVLRAQGDSSGALAAYRQSLSVRERLAAADPSNADWQRDLSFCQSNIGDVLRDQGDLAGALAAYRHSLAVDERLAAADPFKAFWPRDLPVSQDKIGDVLRTQGDLAGALAAYRQLLADAERLASADPSNAWR
jgi:tetratricopeptide (TPR) repeat protein